MGRAALLRSCGRHVKVVRRWGCTRAVLRQRFRKRRRPAFGVSAVAAAMAGLGVYNASAWCASEANTNDSQYDDNGGEECVDERREITVHDIVNQQTVTSAYLSPDGKFIAYRVSIPCAPESSALTDGEMAGEACDSCSSGESACQTMGCEAVEAGAAGWKGVATRAELRIIPFEKSREGCCDGNGDTTSSANAYVHTGPVASIKWSPDSRSVFFRARRASDKGVSLYQLPLTGGEARNIVSCGAKDIKAYDVAYVDDEDLAAINTSAQQQKILAVVSVASDTAGGTLSTKEIRREKKWRKMGFKQQCVEDSGEGGDVGIRPAELRLYVVNDSSGSSNIGTSSLPPEAAVRKLARARSKFLSRKRNVGGVSSKSKRFVRLPTQGLHPTSFRFSPNGLQLAVMFSPSPLADDVLMRKRLFVIDRYHHQTTNNKNNDKSNSSSNDDLVPRLRELNRALSKASDSSAALIPCKVKGPPVWSPSSDWIAYISGSGPHDPSASQLHVVNIRENDGSIDGGDAAVHVMTPDAFDGHVLQTEWMNDNIIAFAAAEGCFTTLRWARVPVHNNVGVGESIESANSTSTPSGKECGTIIPPGVAAWSMFSVSRHHHHNSNQDTASRIALVGSTPRHPVNIWGMEWSIDPCTIGGITKKRGDDIKRKLPVRLVSVNPPFLSRCLGNDNGKRSSALGSQSVVRYKCRDGVFVEGILLWPAGYEAEQRERVQQQKEKEEGGKETQEQLYPLIVYVHGGPESRCSQGWVSRYCNPGQAAASRGYFVFCPNYRGSIGRGVAFSQLNQGRLAQEEFNDVIDGIEFLVSNESEIPAAQSAGLGLPIDRSRVGITGVSYGGYFTAWGATAASKYFQAGVMLAGVSDQVAKINSTDIPEEMYLVHWKKRLCDDFDAYVKASPIKYVGKNARTPLLIAHGSSDRRVDPTQSLELFRAMKSMHKQYEWEQLREQRVQPEKQQQSDCTTDVDCKQGGEHNKIVEPPPAVRLVFYPRERHGLRLYASRLDYALRQNRWFDHFLKGKGGDVFMHMDGVGSSNASPSDARGGDDESDDESWRRKRKPPPPRVDYRNKRPK